MIARRAAAVIALLLAGGCEAPTPELGWSVAPGDGLDPDDLIAVELSIRPGECGRGGGAAPLYWQGLRRDAMEAPATPPSLPPGEYCFGAVGRDGLCTEIARAERTLQLPAQTEFPLELVLEPVAGPSGCGVEECDLGLCPAPEVRPPDAGLDRDAGTDSDAGPPPRECRIDGDSCPGSGACCDGRCVELGTDDHCTECGDACAAGESCRPSFFDGGDLACLCDAGLLDCDGEPGCETLADESGCEECGVACNPGETCEAGAVDVRGTIYEYTRCRCNDVPVGDGVSVPQSCSAGQRCCDETCVTDTGSCG